MRRRRVLAGITAVAGCVAMRAPAAAALGGARDVADLLFDLYAAQSVRLSIANALRQRPPGTEAVLSPHLPAMVNALARHRDAFSEAMSRAIGAHVTPEDLPRLRDSLRSSPPALDAQQRSALFEVDAEFRRSAQAVIGAMTADIALMIATSLAETKNVNR